MDAPAQGEANFQLEGHQIKVNYVWLLTSLAFKDDASLWPFLPAMAMATRRFGSCLPMAWPLPPGAPGTHPGPPTAPPPRCSQPEAH